VTLHRIHLSDAIRDTGLSHWSSTGEPVDVQGEQMVRLPHGSIVPARDWHPTLAEALRCAANRIEQLGLRLVAQASSLRAEADKETND
jgi:hypothetical protein